MSPVYTILSHQGRGGFYCRKEKGTEISVFEAIIFH
jgi:hypothetical protein